MKNSNHKSVSETVCDIDNSEVASENSAISEVRDVLSQILREGAQKMLQTAIQQEVASALGLEVGSLTFVIKSAHVYDTEFDYMRGVLAHSS